MRNIRKNTARFCLARPEEDAKSVAGFSAAPTPFEDWGLAPTNAGC